MLVLNGLWITEVRLGVKCLRFTYLRGYYRGELYKNKKQNLRKVQAQPKKPTKIAYHPCGAISANTKTKHQNANYCEYVFTYNLVYNRERDLYGSGPVFCFYGNRGGWHSLIRA